MRLSIPCRAAVLAVAVVALSPAARAQAPAYPYPPPPGAVPAPPPPSAMPVAPAAPDASEIATCICMRRSIDALGANMAARRHAYDSVRSELSDIDARLSGERSHLDVNNPDAVARFRQLLGERDAIFRRSTGPIAADVSSATARYNSRVSEYNTRCANQPQNSELVSRVASSLSCPPAY